MEKLYEREDLSRKVLEIDIESPVFNYMIKDLNKEIERCIEKVYENESEGGEITLKLNIAIPEAYEILPKEGEAGEMLSETYKYRQPRFEHKLTTTLKKQYKQEGLYTDKKDIQLKDGKYVAVSIKDVEVYFDEA